MTKPLLADLICCAAFVICIGNLPRLGHSQQTEVRPNAEPRPATVCEVRKDGASFDGKRVVVHAFVEGGIPHGIVLCDDRCQGGLVMDAPASVREHDDYVAFMRAVIQNGGAFTRKSRPRVTAEFNGILEYHPTDREMFVLNVDHISGIEVKQTVKKSVAGAH